MAGASVTGQQSAAQPLPEALLLRRLHRSRIATITQPLRPRLRRLRRVQVVDRPQFVELLLPVDVQFFEFARTCAWRFRVSSCCCRKSLLTYDAASSAQVVFSGRAAVELLRAAAAMTVEGGCNLVDSQVLDNLGPFPARGRVELGDGVSHRLIFDTGSADTWIWQTQKECNE